MTNHHGSSALELNENADLISFEEYHPFGTTSYRSVANFAEVSLKRYKYVYKELDNETGLYNYGMRYYAPHIARFVSVDPLQFDYPDLTSFQYASNRPISAIDLDGKEAYFIHGTTNTVVAGYKISPGTHYFYKKQNIVKQLPKAFNNSTIDVSFRWSGDDTNKERKKSGLDLAEHIIKTNNPNEAITIIGHSHGGNVAIEAALILVNTYKINPANINIIALNTPDRQEQTIPEESKINLYSISANGDIVQELGSNGFDSNGIFVDNADAYILFEDQISGGPCDFSNHCPSDESFDIWFPELKRVIKKTWIDIVNENGKWEIENNQNNHGKYEEIKKT